ncbi:hypothetical protein [Candidatus Enterovibrio altilux]|nr:hypothetical protein [Candidatus Enterovibrio luxaltus]
MFRVKTLLLGILNLMDHNFQTSDSYVMIQALHKMLELGELKIQVIV